MPASQLAQGTIGIIFSSFYPPNPKKLYQSSPALGQDPFASQPASPGDDWYNFFHFLSPKPQKIIPIVPSPRPGPFASQLASPGDDWYNFFQFLCPKPQKIIPIVPSPRPGPLRQPASQLAQGTIGIILSSFYPPNPQKLYQSSPALGQDPFASQPASPGDDWYNFFQFLSPKPQKNIPIFPSPRPGPLCQPAS